MNASPRPDGTAADEATALAVSLLSDLDMSSASARIRIQGEEPVLAARYPLATRAAAVLAAVGVVSSALWERRGGGEQEVTVDLRHAGALMRGFYDMELDGEILDTAPTDRLPLARSYETADGRWLQLYAVMEGRCLRAARS